MALTGAGISVESGIPPFRGKGGIWEKIDPMEFAHIDTFMRDPERVWNVLIREMKTALDQAAPNTGHLGLSRLERMGILSTVITQNVDGLHQSAGNTDVIEFHGSFAWQRCMDCGERVETRGVSLTHIPPRCRCGGILRPDCVFFGETIPPNALARSQRAASRCPVMLVIGTSAVVQPAAFMPVIAKQNGAIIIEINPESTPLTATISDYLIQGKAGEVLERILAALEGMDIVMKWEMTFIPFSPARVKHLSEPVTPPPTQTGGWVRTVTLTPPSLADNTADAERLMAALKAELRTESVALDLSLARRLPGVLREGGWAVRCTLFQDRRGWRVVEAWPASEPRPAAGLAVDLGTSRVVLRLLDLASGQPLGETAFDNPQIAVGPDVLARIHAADRPEGLAALNRLIVDGLNRHAAALCRSRGMTPTDIHLTAVAGNTAMTHLFLGLDPRWMIREPYIPAGQPPGPADRRRGGPRLQPQRPGAGVPQRGQLFRRRPDRRDPVRRPAPFRGNGHPGGRGHQRRGGGGQRTLADRLRRAPPDRPWKEG